MTMKAQIIGLMDKFPDTVIAAKVGCHQAYVRHVRGEVGAVSRRKRIDEKKFRELHSLGTPDAKIARILGHSHVGVWLLRERLGLPRNAAGSR